MSNIVPFESPPPGPITIRTFQALRSFLVDYIVNRWMQYVQTYFRSELLPVLNTQMYNYGPDLASGPAIKPSALVQQITGSATIATIHPPLNFAGQFYAVAKDGFSTNTSDNILLPVTVPAGSMAEFVYHPVLKKWSVLTPSTGSGGGGGGIPEAPATAQQPYTRNGATASWVLLALDGGTY